MKNANSLVIVATLAIGATSAAISQPLQVRATGSDIAIDPSVKKTAAFDVFKNTKIVYPVEQLQTRQIPEPDPNRPAIIPEYVFVLQCTDVGFHGECLVFGSTPGKCVSYFDYQVANSTEISDVYNNKVLSLSSNTGGTCQFYKFKGCDNKGDDRGLSSSYNYDLGVAEKDDPRTVEYKNEITSWKC